MRFALPCQSVGFFDDDVDIMNWTGRSLEECTAVVREAVIRKRWCSWSPRSLSFDTIRYSTVRMRQTQANRSLRFFPLDEAIASRAVFVIISGSDGRAGGRTDGREDGNAF